MSRRLLIALALVSVPLLGDTAVGAPLGPPSDRDCLVAWNASPNRTNRARLVAAARPAAALSLRGGMSSTDTWKKASSTTQDSSEACLLWLAKPGKLQLVTGAWNSGRVSHWSWGNVIARKAAVFANVKLLPDGRVAKIYRH